MNEAWADVPCAPAYEISSIGRVRRKAGTYGCRFGRVMKPKLDKAGYFAIALSLGTKGSYRYTHVHRLMCEAFFGPPPSPDHESAHWDGCQTNNLLSNLRWATVSENAYDRVRHGTQNCMKGEDHPMAKLTDVAVIQIRKMRRAGASLAELSSCFHVHMITIYDAATGETWKHIAEEPVRGRRFAKEVSR